MRTALVLVLLTVTCGCDRTPPSYPPPEQRHPLEAPAAPTRASMMVYMNDDDAPVHFVRDISAALEGSTWRWTQKRPTLKVLLVKTAGLKYLVDFTLPEPTMQQTGPVNISFFLGDRLLDKVRYAKPGFQHYEKPIPPEWLQTTTETEISAEIDKLYKSPTDGATLGFIMTRMGFERR